MLLAASCLLCACDGPWQLDSSVLAVRNASEYRQVLAIEYYAGPFACDAAPDRTVALDDADYEDPTVEELVSGATAPLVPADKELVDAMCGTALLHSELAGTVRIAWDVRNEDLNDLTLEEPRPGVVYLERFGAQLIATPGPGMFVFESEEARE